MLNFMPGIDEIRAAFGNGDAMRGKELLQAIASRLDHARAKHSDWQGRGPYWALSALHDEYLETERAILHEPEYRQKDELLDVIAVAARMWLDEYADDGEEWD